MPSRSSISPATPLAAVEPVATTQGGVLVLKAQVGERIAVGQVLAHVIDPISDRVEEVRSAVAGILYARSNRRMATAGMVIAHVAGTEAYRSGYLLSP